MLKATVSAVMLGMGIASGQRVNWSIQVRRYMKPLEGGRGPTPYRNVHQCYVQSNSAFTQYNNRLKTDYTETYTHLYSNVYIRITDDYGTVHDTSPHQVSI